MDDAPVPDSFSSGFAPASREDWEALALKTLKGAGLESLDTSTADGTWLEPLYAWDNAPSPAPIRLRAGGWAIRARIAAGDGANERALGALTGGADSLIVEAFDGGAHLARTLEGVLTDLAPVALDAGFAGTLAARALDLVAKASPAAPLAFHMDPISAFARQGTSPGPIESHLAAMSELGAALGESYPKASLCLASGVTAHEAGASPAEEIAMAAGAALACVKALTAAGLSMADAWSRIVLGLAVDAQPLAGVAKLRAARAVWDRMAGACGVAVPARIEASSSGRMLSRSDHWTNLMRLTAAAFAAAVGGADAVVLDAFTEPLGKPLDPLALRQARNIALVLREEAHLAAPADPAAGAWALEARTEALARAAWDAFTAIEGRGGILAALRGGAVAQAALRGREALEADLRERRLRIIGVTDHRPAEPPAASSPIPPRPTAAVRFEGSDSRCPPLTPIRLEDLAA
jgi:methylmalonyl-CoA mutase